MSYIKTKKPNLFIVGQPKSGTSYLYKVLNRHSKIFMCPFKETNYFSNDVNWKITKDRKIKSRNFANTEDEYLKLFESAKSECFLGEATTAYLYSKEAANRIFKFNPKAKIIALFREPISFLFSYHSQLLFSGDENEEQFQLALQKEFDSRRLEKYPVGSRPMLSLYMQRIKYAEQLKRFLRRFPKKNIKVIIYKDFKSNNLKVIKEIQSFLGINEEDILIPKNIHTSKRLYSRKINGIVKFFQISGLVNNINKVNFLHLFLKKIKRIIVTINSKNYKREPLDNFFIKKLKKKIYPEVKKFNDYLKREGLIDDNNNVINKWGYDKIE